MLEEEQHARHERDPWTLCRNPFQEQDIGEHAPYDLGLQGDIDQKNQQTEDRHDRIFLQIKGN